MILLLLFVTIVSMLLTIVRASKGPTAYDRILAANMFGTKTVVLILAIAFLFGDMMYIDIALVYALINFISVIALLKYFRFGSLSEEKDS